MLRDTVAVINISHIKLDFRSKKQLQISSQFYALIKLGAPAFQSSEFFWKPLVRQSTDVAESTGKSCEKENNFAIKNDCTYIN